MATAGAARAVAEKTYQEPWRPQFHYSQPDLFVNDPNGLVHYDGEYHLFYQYRLGAGLDIVWGHAVSRDLLHWENLPVAIPRGADDKSIFSGSVVIDEDNTSGFGEPGNPAMVAIYTAFGQGNQSQALAYSLDHGRTFTKYEGNPVLDLGLSQFRDPKVFWHGATNRWVMVVAMSDDRQVAIYGSPNLKRWELLSKWGPLPPVGGQYEVPDLFPLRVDSDPARTKWVMIISTNPGGLWGGSLIAAYIGEFDGTTFKEDARYAYHGAPGTTLLAGFDGADGQWTTTGTATRMLVTPAFTISKRYVNFQIGGTSAATTTPTRVDLVVDDEVVRSATGDGGDALDWVAWDVADLRGKSARIEIVDANACTSGRILVDEIGFSDTAALPGVERTPWLDWGKDNYAGITFENLPDDRRLFVGWLNNWQYAQSPLVPTTQWWRGQHSEPRELALVTIDGRPELVQQPLRELDQLHAGKPYQETDRKVTGERTVGAAGKQLDIRLRLHSGTASRAGVKVLIGSNGDETVVGYDAAARRVYIDRTRSGTAGDVLTGFAGVHSAPLQVHGDELDLRILVDHSIVEVFANHGERVLTDLVYPAMDSDGIALFAEGGTAEVQELVVNQMRSIWSPTGASVNAR